MILLKKIYMNLFKKRRMNTFIKKHLFEVVKF